MVLTLAILVAYTLTSPRVALTVACSPMTALTFWFTTLTATKPPTAPSPFADTPVW